MLTSLKPFKISVSYNSDTSYSNIENVEHIFHVEGSMD